MNSSISPQKVREVVARIPEGPRESPWAAVDERQAAGAGSGLLAVAMSWRRRVVGYMQVVRGGLQTVVGGLQTAGGGLQTVADEM